MPEIDRSAGQADAGASAHEPAPLEDHAAPRGEELDRQVIDWLAEAACRTPARRTDHRAAQSPPHPLTAAGPQGLRFCVVCVVCVVAILKC